MQYSIRITQADFERLRGLLFEVEGIESAAMLLAGVSTNGAQRHLLVRRVVAVPNTEYRVRTRHRIELTARAINGLAALAEENGLVPMVAHSHPDPVGYSVSDDHGEARLAQTLYPFAPVPIFGSMLLTPDFVIGRAWVDHRESPVNADEIRVIGRRLDLQHQHRYHDHPSPMELTHDRQIRAFGRAGQQRLAGLRVGIVGSGGTGSPLAEQLVRLGVRDILIIDRDHFEPSNVSRVYGSVAADVTPSFLRAIWRRNRSKVAIVGAHLHRINPRANVVAVSGDVVQRGTAEKLLDRDVLFACTDDHWGRSIVNQIAYQYLIPTANLGVAIASDEGQITGGVGVVQILRPDHGCLWCSEYLSADRIRAESLPPEERRALQAEGYLLDVDEPAPSIVTVTTLTSSVAGTWLIQLVTDFMGAKGDVSRFNYDITDGTIRRGLISPKEECVCRTVKGFGDLKPMPM